MRKRSRLYIADISIKDFYQNKQLCFRLSHERIPVSRWQTDYLCVSGGASRNHGRRWESRSSDASARERGVSLIRSVYALKLLSMSVLVCALSYFYVYRLCKLTLLNALKVVNRPAVHRTVHKNKFWHIVLTLMFFQTWMIVFMRNKKICY